MTTEIPCVLVDGTEFDGYTKAPVIPYPRALLHEALSTPFSQENNQLFSVLLSGAVGSRVSDRPASSQS